MTEESTQTDVTETVETVDATVKPEKTKQIVKELKIRDQNDAILELRRENEKLRKTLDETSTKRAEELANQKLEALRAEVEEKANRSAESLLEQRLAKMEEDARSRLVKSELKAAAHRAGVIDWEDAYEILKRNDLKLVEFTDDGEVANAAEIIAAMKTKKAHLFADISTASTARTPAHREVAVEKSALTMNAAEYAIAKAKLLRM